MEELLKLYQAAYIREKEREKEKQQKENK